MRGKEGRRKRRGKGEGGAQGDGDGGLDEKCTPRHLAKQNIPLPLALLDPTAVVAP